MTDFTLVLNAGGRSRRMGENKALLPVPPHDTPLVNVLATRLQVLRPQATFVVSDDEAVRAVVADGFGEPLDDAFANAGPLSGIVAALRRARGWVLVVACDMPLLNPAVLGCLIALTDDVWDAVVPHVNDRYQTMHALYHRRCLPAIEAAMARGSRRAVSFYGDVRLRTVKEDEYRQFDPAARSLINVNTPEEWAAALKELSQN